jgi:hypothetical protein
MDIHSVAKELLLIILAQIPVESKLAFFCTCKSFNSLLIDKSAVLRQIFEGDVI